MRKTHYHILQYTFVTFFTFLTFSTSAQQKWKGWGIPEVGVLSGSYQVTGDLRLQGGVQKNGWMIGLGSGFDYYRFTSVPVYAQGRKMFGKRKSKPFIMTSLGVNFPTTTSSNEIPTSDIMWSIRSQFPSGPTRTYNMGIYGEIGLGYALLSKKGRGLMFSLSYTQKRIKESSLQYIYAGTVMDEPTPEINEYIMNRAAVRIGYKF